MKRYICLILLLVLFLPVVSLADYSPALGMTMNDYIMKYNGAQAPLGAPYIALGEPYSWTTWNEYNVAWFHADNEGIVTILLLTKDPADTKTLNSGLDAIQIFAKSDSDFVPLISVANHCAGLFAADLVGKNLSPQCVANAIVNYFESNCKANGQLSFAYLDNTQTNALSFFYDGTYFFQITTVEAIK